MVAMLMWAVRAGAASYVSGEVVVVEDTTGAQHDPEQQNFLLGLATTMCQFASNGLYGLKPDDFDGVVMFTTHPMNTMDLGIQNVQRGNIVRQTDHGLSPLGFGSLTPATAYGSPAKLSQCVYMGSLGQLPLDPDAQATTLFGGILPISMGITGAELMGHEYGHHWLVWSTYDKNDGTGPQALMRGDSQSDTTMPANPNGHYNAYADARSVMYGSFITQTAPGQYSMAGGVRKYNEFDQYFMGLRDPSEVSPMLIVDDGSHRGHDIQPLWRTASGSLTGTPISVDIADVIRAVGRRAPAYPNTQKCLRVAFVLVAHQGHTATAAEIAKVDAWRQRFESWFSFATDGRGSMDTSLTPGLGKCAVPTDAGVVVVPDAGPVVVEPDAGVVEVPDAGTVEVVDAGMVDMPVADAGTPPSKEDTKIDLTPRGFRPGCGCSSGGDIIFALIAVGGLLRRRKR